MKTRPGRSLVLAFLAMVCAGAARAQVARVFVSVNGSDGNVCSNVTTPCRSLSAGISQVDPGGEVIVLDSGSYGGFSIAKSVKINVPSGVVAFTAQPITVAAGATDAVVLRGLTIKAVNPGVGTGILFTSGQSLFVETCVVDGWDVGIDIAGPGNTSIADTTVRNCRRNGVWARPASGTAIVAVESSRLENNGLTTAFCGLDVLSNAQVSVRKSTFAGNVFGLCAGGATAVLNVAESLITNQQAEGLEAESGSTIRYVNCIITQNGLGVRNFMSTAAVQSIGNSIVAGNVVADTQGTITTIPGH
jgi:hypothetical protein